ELHALQAREAVQDLVVEAGTIALGQRRQELVGGQRRHADHPQRALRLDLGQVASGGRAGDEAQHQRRAEGETADRPPVETGKPLGSASILPQVSSFRKPPFAGPWPSAPGTQYDAAYESDFGRPASRLVASGPVGPRRYAAAGPDRDHELLAEPEALRGLR